MEGKGEIMEVHQRTGYQQGVKKEGKKHWGGNTALEAITHNELTKEQTERSGPAGCSAKKDSREKSGPVV